MDNQPHPTSLQSQSGRSFDGLPVLPVLMGWCLNNDRVFVYGFNGVYVLRGIVDYPQAIEFLASGFQLPEG